MPVALFFSPLYILRSQAAAVQIFLRLFFLRVSLSLSISSPGVYIYLYPYLYMYTLRDGGLLFIRRESWTVKFRSTASPLTTGMI